MFHGPWAHLGHGHRFLERGALKNYILDLVSQEPRHGYDIMREMEKQSSGYYCPSPGSVYPTLQLLEDEGLVKLLSEEGKKIYEITEAGMEHIKRHKEDIERNKEHLSDCCGQGHNGAHKLMSGMQQMREHRHQLKRFFFEIANAYFLARGDQEKTSRIGDVLAGASKDINKIVSEGNTSDA